MSAHNFAFFLLLLQTPRAAQSRHPTCVVIHGVPMDPYSSEEKESKYFHIPCAVLLLLLLFDAICTCILLSYRPSSTNVHYVCT